MIFKCGLVILTSTYIVSLCFRVLQETNSLDTGLGFLYIASGAIAGKILYDRYQQIHVLGSLTPNPNVTSFANRIASFSASFLSLGFLVYYFLFLFKTIISLACLYQHQPITFPLLGLGSSLVVERVWAIIHHAGPVRLGGYHMSPNFVVLGHAGFLTMFSFTVIKVDSHCITALGIFICGFGTLYIWMQSIITTYLSTLYYDKRLTLLRQCLANVSFLLLVVMAIFGTVTSLLPGGGSSALYACILITSVCSYMLAGIFCIFILSFEKEYEYFSEGFRSELLLDDDCSVSNGTLSDVDSIFGTQELESNAIVIKGNVNCAKMS